MMRTFALLHWEHLSGRSPGRHPRGILKIVGTWVRRRDLNPEVAWDHAQVLLGRGLVVSRDAEYVAHKQTCYSALRMASLPLTPRSLPFADVFHCHVVSYPLPFVCRSTPEFI